MRDARAAQLPAVLATIALMVSACGGTAGEGGADASNADAKDAGAPVAGGDLVVALSEDPDVLDPSLGRTLVGREVFVNMCEKLYDIDEGLSFVPQLAADVPEVSSDGLTVTIPLRPGVNFNDGTPLDAKAVKTSLDRHISLEGSARRSELAAVQAVDVVDPATVRLTLSEPFAPLVGQLADRAGMIMSPAQLEKLGDDFGTHPVCVGPYSFVSRQVGNEIVLEKSQEYYDAEKVNLDSVVYRIISDGNARLANVRSGDVQVAERISPTDVSKVEADNSLHLVTGESLGYMAIAINIGNTAGVGQPVGKPSTPMGTSKELRKAFELSLDRDAINEVVFAGRFVPGCHPLPPGHPYLDDSLTCTEQDLDEAKKIVADSGVPTPVPVDLMVVASPENLRLAQVVQSLAKEAGFDVKVRPVENAASLDAADAGDYDTWQFFWSGRADPDGNITDFLLTGGVRNWFGLSNTQVDEALAVSRATLDTAKRKEAFTDALTIAAEERPIIYLLHQRNFLASTEDVVGIEVLPDGLPRLKTAGFTE
jgi:peptide/nickel transport system substrate-binding protein